MSKKRKQYKSRTFLRDRCCCCSEFRALVRTFPNASNSEPLLLLMMEGRSRADVATLRCHDVETSRRYRLLTFIMVDPTSRRCGVTTWGRYDAPAIFMLCFPLLQFASKICSFHLICTCIHRTCHTQVSSHKKYIFKCKIVLKTKDRRGYTLSVLGTHHPPKLSFLLVPKQDWTLNKIHTLHIRI